MNLKVTPTSLRNGGLAQGKRNAQNGHMQRIQKLGASLGGTKGGPAATHLRWHLLRNKPNPDKCELCAEELRNETKKQFGNASGAGNTPDSSPTEIGTTNTETA
jgi:hypothetical protein